MGFKTESSPSKVGCRLVWVPVTKSKHRGETTAGGDGGVGWGGGGGGVGVDIGSVGQ